MIFPTMVFDAKGYLDRSLKSWCSRDYIPERGDLLVELVTRWNDWMNFTVDYLHQNDDDSWTDSRTNEVLADPIELRLMDNELLRRVKELLEAGVDPNYQDSGGLRALDGFSPDEYGIINSGSRHMVDVLRLLLQYGADPNYRGFSGMETKEGGGFGFTTLMSAAETGFPELIEVLLEYNADTELLDWHGYGDALALAKIGLEDSLQHPIVWGYRHRPNAREIYERIVFLIENHRQNKRKREREEETGRYLKRLRTVDDDFNSHYC